MQIITLYLVTAVHNKNIHRLHFNLIHTFKHNVTKPFTIFNEAKGSK
jgi:hypothetical protein